MSLIVALKDNNKAYIATDCFGLGSYANNSCDSNLKIWIPENTKNTIVGATGAIDEILSFRYCKNLFREDTNGDIDHESVVKNTMVKLLPRIKEMKLNNDEALKTYTSLFIANKNRIFLVDPLLVTYEVNEFYVTGYSREYAQGVLDTTRGKDPIYRIVAAIFEASKHNLGIVYPLIISNTETREIIKIDRVLARKIVKRGYYKEKK